MKSDTICAVATPPGSGGVGIIRISGPESLSAATSFFKSSNRNFKGFKPYTMHHGHITGLEGEVVDEVLAVFMPGPGSYTGEDTVEINCHGGRAVLAAVLERVMNSGPRQAMPGEFTKRAFLNGKLDLTQARPWLN